MENCLIFGSARSGTSLLASMMHARGYFLGEDLIAPNALNERGFFESLTINAINDSLMRQVRRPSPAPSWLSVVPEEFELPEVRENSQLTQWLARRPFCFKDPRLSITYPAWKPLIPPNTPCIVMFRHPNAFVASVLRGVQLGIWNFIPEVGALLASWLSFYVNILRNDSGNFVYVRFEHLVDGSAIRCLSDILDVSLDPGFVQTKMVHFKENDDGSPLSDEMAGVFERLCHRGVSVNTMRNA